jgi:hypothetical protein
MNARSLYRLAGVAAMLGGGLRIASSAQLGLDRLALEVLWTAIDIFLTLGLIGIYLVRAGKLGFLGLASFTVAMAAFSFIGGPDADVFGFSTYEQGAATLAIALIGLSIAWLRTGERPLAPPVLWFGSAVAAGLLDMTPALAPYAFPVAGALFGAGFVAAGWDLLAKEAPAA